MRRRNPCVGALDLCRMEAGNQGNLLDWNAFEYSGVLRRVKAQVGDEIHRPDVVRGSQLPRSVNEHLRDEELAADANPDVDLEVQFAQVLDDDPIALVAPRARSPAFRRSVAGDAIGTLVIADRVIRVEAHVDERLGIECSHSVTCGHLALRALRRGDCKRRRRLGRGGSLCEHLVADVATARSCCTSASRIRAGSRLHNTSTSSAGSKRPGLLVSVQRS